jgi:hypothetical protein
MKIKSGIKKLLSSKTILYTVAFVLFLNITSMILKNDIKSLLFLLVLIVIIHFYSKNMIIVLGGSLIIYYIIYSLGFFSATSNWRKEGLENNDDIKKTDETSESTNKANDKTKQEKIDKTIQQINKKGNPSSSSQGLVMTPLDNSSEPTTNTTDSSATTDESFEVGRSKKNSNGYNVDYASTIEDAYDELNKILGSDGIKRLTGDTQKLMKQQLQLAESMKGMQPLIAGMAPLMEQAKGLLGNMGENGNLNNLANIADKFSSNFGNNSAK